MSLPADLSRLPARENESHKGDYGRLLLIGGSQGMAGSIALSGMAALRSGAGLVTIATPEICQPTVAGYEPSYMTKALSHGESGEVDEDAQRQVESLLENANALACGPGLGRGPGPERFVNWLQTTARQPLVLDADALFALSDQPNALQQAAGPRVLTPHMGEFSRLVGKKVEASLAEPSAREFARQHGVVLVLKGHRTLITDGERVARNTTGNPGMATGGTGDVLTGVLAALLGQGMSPWDAARLGVFVHGRAGDLAAERLGQVSLTARDVVDALPPAFASASA